MHHLGTTANRGATTGGRASLVDKPLVSKSSLSIDYSRIQKLPLNAYKRTRMEQCRFHTLDQSVTERYSSTSTAFPSRIFFACALFLWRRQPTGDATTHNKNPNCATANLGRACRPSSCLASLVTILFDQFKHKSFVAAQELLVLLEPSSRFAEQVGYFAGKRLLYTQLFVFWSSTEREVYNNRLDAAFHSTAGGVVDVHLLRAAPGTCTICGLQESPFGQRCRASRQAGRQGT